MAGASALMGSIRLRRAPLKKLFNTYEARHAEFCWPSGIRTAFPREIYLNLELSVYSNSMAIDNPNTKHMRRLM